MRVSDESSLPLFEGFMRMIKRKLFSDSLIIPALVAFGVIANFLKEVVIAYFYGASIGVDIFRLAVSLPNSFFQSLGTMYVGLFLPFVLSRRPKKLLAESWAILVLSFAIALFGVISSFLIPSLYGPGFTAAQLSKFAWLSLLCWLGFSFLIFTFQRRLWLQAENRKVIVSSTSLILGVSFIAALFLIQSSHIGDSYELAIAFIVSCVILYLIYYLSSFKSISWVDQFKSIDLHSNTAVGLGILALAIGFHAVQLIPRIVDRAFASTLGEGVIAYVEYSYNFYLAIAMVLGTSLVIINSKAIAEMEKSTIDWRLIINRCKAFIAVACLGATIVFFWSDELVELVYLRGAFNSEDAKYTSVVLKYLSLGVPFTVLNILLLQVMYMRGYVVQLLFVAGVRVTAKLVSIAYFINVDHYSAFGISNFICEIAFAITILFLLLKDRPLAVELRNTER